MEVQGNRNPDLSYVYVYIYVVHNKIIRYHVINNEIIFDGRDFERPRPGRFQKDDVTTFQNWKQKLVIP